MDTDRLRRYVELDQAKKDCKAKIREIDREMESLEGPILDEMVDAEVDRVSIAGKTFYPRPTVVATVHNKQAAVEALKKAGLTEYVGESFNNNSLSAYVRECVAEGRELPEEFEGVIEPYETTKIGLRNQ